jgi:hypothetical protein
MFRITALTVAFGLASTAPAARADIIIGDLPGNDLTGILFGMEGSYGIGFTMTNSYQLTDAVLRLSVPSGKTPTVLLMSNVGGNPSAVLFTFTDPSFGSVGTQNYAFTPPSPVTLVGGTTYWLVMEGNSSTDGTIWRGNSPISPSGPGASNFGGRFSVTSFPPTSDSALLLSYELDGVPVTSPVPAPPAVVLVGLGAGCVALKRYVHRRATV